ncbi:MAG: DUF3108 domain-containing protein [Sphingobacteriales bacterium]|jgi:hypothetical protein
MKKVVSTISFILFSSLSIAGGDFCVTNNFSFQPGERITFKVFYSVIGIYIDAGTANFNITRELYNSKPVYHVVADGYSNPRYDWIFKVRDRYESYMDTATLLPLRFVRNVNEGGYKKQENVTFDHQAGKASSTNGVFNVPGCIQDVISAVYQARNINYAKYKPGDKIPFSMFLDDKVYNIYIRYMGTEEVRTKFGRFQAIKLKPMLIKGNAFSGGEKMTLWVSNDWNHIPLRIESPISVGSVKVDMMGYSNLRHPLNALLKDPN